MLANCTLSHSTPSVIHHTHLPAHSRPRDVSSSVVDDASYCICHPLPSPSSPASRASYLFRTQNFLQFETTTLLFESNDNMADENVKVAVRVRPFNSREKGRGSTLIIEMDNPRTVINVRL